MKKRIVHILVGIFLLNVFALSATAQEKIYANYFDIPINSTEGTEVTGRIHLERNKDVWTRSIPKGYHFEIIRQDGDLFTLDTRYDLSKRIMGVLTVNKGENTGRQPKKYYMTVALKETLNLLCMTSSNT